MATLELELFTDYICPWCYLSTPRLGRLLATYDLTLRVTHHPLHPNIPSEGITLEQLFRGRRVDIPALHERMAGLMAGEGLTYVPQRLIPNTRLAQELGAWGNVRSDGKLQGALYRAYFADGKDIASVDALVAVAAGVGLDADEARLVLVDRTFQPEIDRQWTRARDLGVTGVPTFIVGRNGVVGAQPYETLEEMVLASGAQRRETPPAT
jgi:predicted DsbA family dithiol-disulfide isomerase